MQALGVDMDGNNNYPGDIVYIDGNKDNAIIIELDKYRELFDCGYVYGYFVPDYCRKKIQDQTQQ